MILEELKTNIECMLARRLISGRVLLDRFRVVDENTRLTAAYNADNYSQFYHYLGELIEPKTMIKIGFNLGLLAGCFLRMCKTVDYFFAFRDYNAKEYYSSRLGKSNIKDVYKKKFDIHVGLLSDDILEKNNFDLAIIHEEKTYDQHREYLDVVWSKLQLDGLICMDFITRHKPAGEAYVDFCKAKNQVPVIIGTRYGVGIIRK